MPRKKNKVNALDITPPLYTLDKVKIQIRLGRFLNIAIYKPIQKDRSNGNISNSSKHLSVENQSTDSNPAVVFFIHGVGGSHLIWQAQLEYFSNRGYLVIAPDLLGHGLSEAPKGANKYSFEELSRDILAVFDRYCHSGNNFLIGHSYGSSFCALVARERQHRVSKLVFISCGSPSALQPNTSCIFTSPSCVLACAFPCVSRYFVRNAFATDSRIPNKNNAFSVNPYALKHTMLGQVWDEGDESYYHELQLPVLIIHGEKDTLVSTDDDLKLQEVIYGSEIELLENAGHTVMMECPQKVNKIISRFLHRDFSHLFDPDVFETMHRVQSRSIRYDNINQND